MLAVGYAHHQPGDPTPEMRPGDFILTHQDGWINRGIQIAQSFRYPGTRDDGPAYWNHCALVAEGTDAPMVVEALTDHGVVERSLEAAYRDAQYTVVRLDSEKWDREQAVAFARSCLDWPYGWLALGSIGLQLASVLTVSIGVRGAIVCSGLVARSLERGGAIWPYDPELVTPADLAHVFGVPVPRRDKRARGVSR